MALIQKHYPQIYIFHGTPCLECCYILLYTLCPLTFFGVFMKGLDAFTLMDELGIVAAILIFFYLFLEYPFLGFSLYLLPFIISFIRRHRSLTVLSTLNIFAGWFIPVWLVLLTWAIFGEKRITSKTTDTVDTPP